MADSKMRNVLFRRNTAQIYSSATAAQEAILANKASYFDGEQIFGRYTYTDAAGATQVATLVGLVYIDSAKTTTSITFSDATEFNTEINNLSASTTEAITNLSGKSASAVDVKQLTSGTTHQYTSTDADLYEVTTTSLSGATTTDTFQLTYTPYSPSELQVPTTVGDIEKGTKASELNGETISKILDDIIFPTVYPDLKNPSVSIATASSYSSTVKAGTAAPSLKVTYTRGTAKVNDGVTADRNYTGNLTGATWAYGYTAGAANTNAGVSASGTTISTGSPTTITSTISSSSITTSVGGNDAATGDTTGLTLATVGTYYFRATVDYAAGATLTTSKGDTSNPIRYASLNGTENTTKATVTNPHPASSITTSYGVTIYVTMPIYTNSGSTYSADLKTLPLKTWGAMTISDIAYPTTNATTPIVIKTPRKIASFNSYNELAKDYNVPQISSLSTPTTEEIDGVTYYVYTWTGSEVSARNYRIITY